MNARERYLKACEEDFAFFASNEVWIRPKYKTKGGLTQLDLNPGQLVLHETIERVENENQALWLLVLKHRQWGSSTFFQAWTMYRCRFVPYTQALVIGDRERTTRGLMAMNRRMWDNFTPAIRDTWERTIERTDSFYEWGNGSVLSIDTAGQSQAARGMTADLIHGSEVAFWPNGDRIIPAMTSALADVAGSSCVLESTSAGPHGIFWELWDQADDPWSQWKRVFVPWSSHPEYDDTETLDPELRELGELASTGDEEALKQIRNLDEKEFNWLVNGELSLGQIYWRKRTIATRLMGKEEEFSREYPLTAEDAFRSSTYDFLNDYGAGLQRERESDEYEVYDVVLEDMSIAEADKKPFECDPVLSFLDTEPDEREVPVKHTDGWLHVFEKPEEKTEYIIGCDPAEGTGGDNSAFLVRTAGRTVACGFRNDVSTDVLALYLDALGRWYNNATINIERAGGGLAVVNSLIRLGYGNLYGTEAFDEFGEPKGRKVGFTPTAESVRSLLAMFRHDLNSGTFIMRHPRLIKECGWVKRIAKRTSDESISYSWRCPGKGRELKDGYRLSDDLFRAASLTTIPSRDNEWFRELERKKVSMAEPDRSVISDVRLPEFHNPLFEEEVEHVVVSDGTYDLIELEPELDDDYEMPLP